MRRLRLRPDDQKALGKSVLAVVRTVISKGPCCLLVDEAQQCFPMVRKIVHPEFNKPGMCRRSLWCANLFLVSWLVPLYQVANMFNLRLHLAGTRFDFADLPRLRSGHLINDEVLDVRVWHSFKFFGADDVFAHLWPLLNVPEAELRDLCHSVQGRSRNWVYSLQTIIRDPERTFAKISMEAVGDRVESFKAEISRLINTLGIDRKDFIKDLVGNYLELQFNRLEGNTMRLPLYCKHTGIFFVPTTEKVYQVHRAVDIMANKGLIQKVRQFFGIVLGNFMFSFPVLLLWSHCILPPSNRLCLISPSNCFRFSCRH